MKNRPLRNRLRRVLEAHGLTCGAVIDRAGKVIARVGDFGLLDGDVLVSSLLGPYGSAKATHTMVQSPERIKPVMGQQGDDFSVADCAGELVVVVFGSKGGDVIARYELSRLVGQTIAAEFAGRAE